MFVVTKRYGRSETRVGNFRTEQEAIADIMDKLTEDRTFKLAATYGLYEGADMLKEYTQDDIPVTTNEQDISDSSGSKKGSSKSFAPTPFNTTPHLGPRSYIKDDEEDDQKDK